MKKHYSLLMAFLVAFSSFFVSCSENENGSDTATCKIAVISDGDGVVAITNYIGTSVDVLVGDKVEVVASPADGSAFIGWYVGDNDIPVSADNKYTFTVTEDMTLTAKFKLRFDPNGHEYVDLGLPSALKWATCNVGATAPEEYGGYYAWGETEEKSVYDWKTYKWCIDRDDNMTKYCTDEDFGDVDNRIVLDLQDDVARAQWGGSWRMPTHEEFKELLDNCAWQWTTLNGVDGYKVFALNGNSIFLPAAGCRFESQSIGSYGFYWASSLCEYSSSDAYHLRFGSDEYWCGNLQRCYGFSVRPVCE